MTVRPQGVLYYLHASTAYDDLSTTNYIAHTVFFLLFSSSSSSYSAAAAAAASLIISNATYIPFPAAKRVVTSLDEQPATICNIQDPPLHFYSIIKQKSSFFSPSLIAVVAKLLMYAKQPEGRLNGAIQKNCLRFWCVDP